MIAGFAIAAFLLIEQLGLGRHPTDGLRPVQGIEFAFEVMDPG
jgi:hypothetical protein